MKAPTIDRNPIQDDTLRRALEKIAADLKSANPFRDLHFFALTLVKAESAYRFKHNLGFLPKDVLLTSSIGAGVVTFNYVNFTQTELELSSTGPCVLRFFAGTYDEKGAS